ncbi:hypothetical protein SAMN04490182_5655 [Pseudomonas cedrina]|uniref:Uncharacterized protein n=2 Tax=Pseudomonas cedrina TaxID=651740 RepID=A0A1V2K8Z7_PSECE|nr:hypothetical protein [Pseudomonas cedrina]ONH54207.1 hypothetical protein BLL36_11025 [Pseudomonas cedrina subsp. cedrina]SDT59470.1 hypothetical protein SAMN04490182_5655 [Pseudomonas cedrina]
MANTGDTPDMLLDRRAAGFAAFKSERMPVLHKFCESLGFDQPHEVLIEPKKFLPLLDDGFQHAVISEENRVWFVTRIGYYIGEYLISLFDGCWLLDDDPLSPSFAKYVVGDFSIEGVKAKVVDPFEIAQRYAITPAPRFLRQEIETALD